MVRNAEITQWSAEAVHLLVYDRIIDIDINPTNQDGIGQVNWKGGYDGGEKL